jgi:deoxyribodipyrimidine photo-lyase
VVSAVLWFRRDLRLADQPALLAAAQTGPVTALFVLDDALLRPSGLPRITFLYRTLRALDADLRARGGRLVVRTGRPEVVVPAVARAAGAASVHVSADFGPYGAARDARVAAALGEALGESAGETETTAALVRTGSPFAVAPGRITKADGSPYKVYSAFYRAWLEHGWRAPAASATADVDWSDDLPTENIPPDPDQPHGLTLPEAGEAAAARAWLAFGHDRLARYADQRDRPDIDSTSRLSPYLHFGALHPRTLLAGLGPSDETFRKEIAWREFYAAVLHFWPASAREYFIPKMATMRYSGTHPTQTHPDETHLAAWKAGRTGYPIVDAGMRQLLAEGWMHNRVRMIVASFLVKDLHIEWTVGARYFMQQLVDGDLASNQHGWQWTAGTGTDAAPYYRIFNPITQGRKFDPDGSYICRFVPELRGLPGNEVHEPWRRPDGVPPGYVAPIVDHAHERAEAMARYRALT